MNLRLLLFLTFFHYAVSYNVNSIHMRKDHTYVKLLEWRYGISTGEVTDTGLDVGEPLILTPFIEQQKLEEARLAARVNDTFLLPGTESYAGYLTVNKEHNGNLWFWYFPVIGDNKSVNESPLILWLQGGPGATSLFGLFVEIGPFTVLDNGTLKENKYSWGKEYSLLFIDNPVGAGYSFTNDDGYDRNQTTIAENLYKALQQFFTIFPDLRSAPLFIAGESYAGKHIPSLGIQILKHKGQDEPINLQGLAIGNGFIDPITLKGFSEFVRESGVLDDNIANRIKFVENLATEEIRNGSMLTAFYMINTLFELLQRESHLPNLYNYLTDVKVITGNGTLSDSFTKFVQGSDLRRALHVGNTTFSGFKTVYRHLIPDLMNSAKPWLEELLDHYRILVYSGHLDCVVPYHASVNTYKSLEYSGAQTYAISKRLPWYHNGSLAGYFKKGGNLVEVLVRGAGHIVPLDKPAQALGLITAFIRDISLGHDTGNLIN